MRSTRNIESVSNKQIKPFCKVCFDAGKTEQEYTSHFVKNKPGPDGIVVCPQLLSISCNFCQKKGHTISYCTALVKKRKFEAAEIEPSTIKNKTNIHNTEKMKKKMNNIFELLNDDNEEENVSSPLPFPALKHPSTIETFEPTTPPCSPPDNGRKVTYAMMASKPKMAFEQIVSGAFTGTADGLCRIPENRES